MVFSTWEELVVEQVELLLDDVNTAMNYNLRKYILQSPDRMISLARVCSLPEISIHLWLKEVKGVDIPEKILEDVAEILKKSPDLKISKDGKRVGRMKPLPDPLYAPKDSRTLVAFPLPCDSVDIDDVVCAFYQYATVDMARIERGCGYALVTFKTDEEALMVLGKKKIQLYGANLELKSKKEFDTTRRSQQEQGTTVASKRKRSARGLNEMEGSSSSTEEAEFKKYVDDHGEADALESEVVEDGKK